MELNLRRSRKKGSYFPCQTCGVLQYRRPYRTREIKDGKRRVFCKECYLDHIAKITPPEEFVGSNRSSGETIETRQRKGRKYGYIRREEQYYKSLNNLQKKIHNLEFTIAKLEVDGHEEAAKQLRIRIANKYAILGGKLDEERIAKLADKIREEN